MAVSMKDLDPVYQNVGNKEGTNIWRIDRSRPVPIPKSEHGKISSEHCYVILQGRALRSGVLRHEIFYWLGRHAREDDIVGAALKAVELDAALGGHAVVHREAEGHETDNFLSYFKPCFMPTERGKGDNGQHGVRLFMCNGRHVAHVKEVPFTRASLSHEDVLILDTESKIFQFNGVNTDVYHRAKALDVVQYLKENFHRKDCIVAVIEDGKFVADADSGEFWGFFGGFAPLGRKLDNENLNKSNNAAASLSCVCEGQTKLVQESDLKRELLNTNKCYIVDCGKELFAWVGRDTPIEERRSTVLLVEKLISMRGNSYGIKATFAIEGFEPREFKLNFGSWPANAALPVSESGRGKLAVLLKHKGFNVKGLLRAAPAEEHASSFQNNGKLQVWCVSGISKDSVPSSSHGTFLSRNCYIVVHTFPGERKDDYIIYCWQGNESTEETRSTSSQIVNEMESSLKGAVEVRMFEGKEPPQFSSLFKKLFIIKGDGEMGTRLMQVQQSGSDNWQATEVNMDATSLNSSGCFFLQMETTMILWFGKFSTVEEQEATEDLAHYFQPDADPILTLKEGSELEQFWETLGGKKVHPSHREPKEGAKDPRLFTCSIAKGHLQATEVFNFAQNDLLSDEIVVMDCHTDIYVWVGQSVSGKAKSKWIEIGQKYIEQVATYDGRSLETPLYKIMEGFEPAFFRHFFSWNDSKLMQHLNVFQKKVFTLQGHRMQAAWQSSPKRSMRRHSISGVESASEVLATIDRNQITRTGLKSDSSPEKLRAPKVKYGSGRSPGSRSPALSALSSMFEFRGTREVAVPNSMSVTPKLSTVRTRHKSLPASPPPSVTPPRTPRPVASPRSPAIAALASMFEPYSDKKLDFAWPGLRSKSDEKASRESEVRPATEVKVIEEVPPKSVEAANKVSNGDAACYPYERLKVSSPNPVAGIEFSRRETYLSAQDFQDTFRMDKDTFYKLPKWKQDKYKILADLF